MIAQANTSHAYANLSSIERPTHDEDVAYSRLAKDMHDARTSIGWQCIRRPGERG